MHIYDDVIRENKEKIVLGCSSQFINIYDKNIDLK